MHDLYVWQKTFFSWKRCVVNTEIGIVKKKSIQGWCIVVLELQKKRVHKRECRIKGLRVMSLAGWEWPFTQQRVAGYAQVRDACYHEAPHYQDASYSEAPSLARGKHITKHLHWDAYHIEVPTPATGACCNKVLVRYLLQWGTYFVQRDACYTAPHWPEVLAMRCLYRQKMLW